MEDGYLQNIQLPVSFIAGDWGISNLIGRCMNKATPPGSNRFSTAECADPRKSKQGKELVWTRRVRTCCIQCCTFGDSFHGFATLLLHHPSSCVRTDLAEFSFSSIVLYFLDLKLHHQNTCTDITITPELFILLIRGE